MTCHEVEPLLGAYLDNELDLSNSITLERHLGECAACATQYRSLEELRNEIAESGLRYRPTPEFARNVSALAGKSDRQKRWTGWGRTAVLVATAAAVFIPLGVFLRPPSASPSMDRELLDNHLRSLMVSHLVDVPSSDHHTVKPWFQGKLNFSPAVPDLAEQGFVLVGGRVEMLGGRPAAAIVYKRREHVVNLYIAPSQRADAPPALTESQGFRILHWEQNGMSYWAVSDVNAADLWVFGGLVRTHDGSASPEMPAPTR
jgi:anti-sigma factor RsiW